MNLLVRSLSPSGQQASSSNAPSSRSKQQSRHANESKSRHARQSNLSSFGYTQPHMVLHLDADPVPQTALSASTPTSPRSYPWSRFQKPKSGNKPYYDSFSSAPSPDANFDYYEYFSNYGKLSSSPSASPITSPDDPWSHERIRLHEASGGSSRYLGPEPGTTSQPSSFRPGSLSFRKLFRRPGPPSPSQEYPVIGDQMLDRRRPPMPPHYSHFNHSASSPPSPLPTVPSGPSHASSTAPQIKRYFSSPADSCDNQRIMPSGDSYAIIRPVPALDNRQPHYASYRIPSESAYHCQVDTPCLARDALPPAGRQGSFSQPVRYRRRESSLGPPPDRYSRPESHPEAAPQEHLERQPPGLRPELDDFRQGSRISQSLYRISFIETNVYLPQDVPASSASPELMPPHHRFHKHLHGEWVTETVQELKKLFRPPCAQILVNVEKKSKYPFIIYGPLSQDFDTRRFVPTSSCKVLSPELRINDGIYDVCGSISRPTSGLAEQDNSIPALGFVISAFQTFPGEDSQRLEDNWITWTGAQMLYKYLPISAGLRNLIFYKRHDLHLLKHRPTQSMNRVSIAGENALYPIAGSLPTRPDEQRPHVPLADVNEAEAPLISYVLLCECVSLSESILTSVCAVIDQLRARCCGYSALYVNCSVDQVPQQQHQASDASHHQPQRQSLPH